MSVCRTQWAEIRDQNTLPRSKHYDSPQRIVVLVVGRIEQYNVHKYCLAQ